MLGHMGWYEGLTAILSFPLQESSHHSVQAQPTWATVAQTNGYQGKLSVGKKTKEGTDELRV